MDTEAPNPVGHEIAAYNLLGEELKSDGTRVGADVAVDVTPVGWFSLNIITKEKAAAEASNGAELPIDADAAQSKEDIGAYPSLIVEGPAVSDEVLAHLQGTVVDEALARCLVYEPGPELSGT